MSPEHTAARIDKVLLSELVDGVRKTFENAETLYREATLLATSGFLSHALFLHQISLEECAKIEMLGAWATGILLGHEVDAEKVRKAMANHERKNRTNAYFLEISEEEKAARDAGDFSGSMKVFSKMQEEFHRKANIAKNAALYVDFTGGKFVAPNERTTATMLAEIAELNEKHLGISFPRISLLQTMEEDADAIAAELVQFEKRIEDLAAELPDDPVKVFEIAFGEMREAR